MTTAAPLPPSKPDVDGEELSPALKAYYADTKLLYRNILFIILGNLGLNLGLGVSTTLSILHMKASGVSDLTIALMSGINLWVVAYLVMYFSWRSDHTVTRWGRRTPYTFLAMWFIVITTALFPFYTAPISLILLFGVKYLFNDMQASTWSLIVIDCIPRRLLGRIMAINAVAGGVAGFAVSRYGMALAETHEELVFLLSAGIVFVFLSIAMLGVKEPPFNNPATTPFRPWSAMQVGFKDRRIIILMLGVTMLYGFMQMWGFWHPLWATNSEGQGLGLSKTELGEVVSWGALLSIIIALPNGYLVDKVPGIRILTIFWALQLASLLYVLSFVHSSAGLLVVCLMTYSYGGLFTAGDIMIIKSAHPKDIGSVTSSNAFIRNLYNGSLAFFGGIAVTWAGNDKPNYMNALILGTCMATLGLSTIFSYAWLTRTKKALDV